MLWIENREDETIPECLFYEGLKMFDSDAHFVNDGNGVYVDCNGFVYSNHEHNLGISKSKNEILSYLISNGCDYMFIIEDDILITEDGYINLSSQIIKTVEDIESYLNK